MTPETILLVQQSFRWMLPEAEHAGAAFLAQLDREAPDLARLLPTASLAERRRLVAAFAFVIGTLGDFENMRPALRAAGAHYRTLGVGAEEYARFGAVLLDTVEQVMGRAWNPHLATAWADVWTWVSAVMQSAEPQTRVAA